MSANGSANGSADENPDVGARALPLAVTMGEPAGIGGEILLKAWAARHETGLPPFFAIDDPARLRRLAGTLMPEVAIRAISDPSEALAEDPALPVLPVGVDVDAVPGAPSASTASAVLCAIETAVSLALQGVIGGLVTNPIQKQVLYEAGFAHPGHTEFLASLCPGAPVPVMMLAVPGLRVVPATVHIALSAVPQALSRDVLIERGRILAAALARDFGLARPRLAVAGLNPHAGEAGTMGREEIDIITPAIEALQAEGIDARGPYPADTLFHAQARARYDAALCMYHDQALIPLKTIDFDHGVNITLGLPVVRTSPDHGTALDIAGKGIASPASLMAAIAAAGEIAAHRAAAKR